MKRLAPYLCVLAVTASAVRAEETVKVGSKPFTESVILGETLAHLLRAAGFRAQHRAELGGTAIIFEALKAGEIDAYVEYTGTITHELLAGKNLRDEDAMRRELARQRIVLGGKLGFANNYALGIRPEVAGRHQIRTIGDLARHPEVRVGLSDEFIGRPEWKAVKARYGLPHEPKGMNHQLALVALAADQLDVTDLYSTDAEIKQYNLRTLEDDRGVFPPYHAVLLWRSDLDQRFPGAVRALRRLEGRISTDTMVDLNASVQITRVPETEAAARFLEREFGVDVPRTGATGRWERLARLVGVCTLQHLLLVSVSLAAAVLLAVPLGIAAHRRPRVGSFILGAVGVIQTVPSMALLVFLIPFLGLGNVPALVALFLYSLLPIVRNTATGLGDIPPALRESAEVIGLPARARLWRIELPLASRSIMAGIKTAAVINVGTATIGAIIGAGGYGQPILTGIRLNDLATILSGAVPAALMALLVQQLFGWLELLVVPRGLRTA